MIHTYQLMIIDNERLVGFFCLHLHDGPAYYGGDFDTDVLIRALSIDERYRHQHLALSAMLIVNKYVQENFANIERIILAVNHANLVAQNTYKKSWISRFRYSNLWQIGAAIHFLQKSQSIESKKQKLKKDRPNY